MSFDMLIGITGGPKSLLPEVRETAPFDRLEPASQVSEEC